MAGKETEIHVGRIDFTNVWPVFYYFPPKSLSERIRMTNLVPTGLNRAMREGKIDVAAISSFAYGVSCDRYLLFPDLSVSTRGKVKSILLFYREPFERVLNGRIALTTASATSVNLLKIILEKFYQGKPSYISRSPNLQQMMDEADGALLIGDDAIRASFAKPPFAVMDLGETWFKLTGKWMTYAVWAVRKEAAERRPELIEEIFRAFQESKTRGVNHPEEMVLEARKRYDGTEEFWRGYFSNLSYDFGPEQWDGLLLYFRLAREMGLLDKEVALQFWNETKAIRVNE